MQSATPDFFSGSRDAVIRVYDAAGNVIETPGARASSKSDDSLRQRDGAPPLGARGSIMMTVALPVGSTRRESPTPPRWTE